MLDVKFIKENKERVKESAMYKRCDVDIDTFIQLSDKSKDILQQFEALKADQNKRSKEFGKKQKEMTKEEKASSQRDLQAASMLVKSKADELEEARKKAREMHVRIPNVANTDVPKGADESSNEVLREWGEKKTFSFTAKDHLDIAEPRRMLDMKRGGKITGSGFGLYMGEGALLERALINFMLNYHIKHHGYTEVLPPFMVNRESMFGTGQLPKLEEDMYHTAEDDLFLIPTAEVPVTNIHRDEMMLEKDLPRYYVSYTPCFRREAGSYGKDTRGISRVHQFNKVEMVKFTTPEASYDEHEKLLKDAEDILQALGLAYRVVLLSAGDMSFAAAKCYDLEVWAPGSERWLEVSSCSNFEDFQARRANIRYKPKDGGKPQFVHTLNASGLALPRIFIALLENYQNEDGSVSYPDVLNPHMSI